MSVIYDDLHRYGFVKVLADYQEGGWAFEGWYGVRPSSPSFGEWYLYVPQEEVDKIVIVEYLSSWVNDYLLCNLSAFQSTNSEFWGNEGWQDSWLDWCRKLVKEPALLPKNDGILYAGFTFLRDLTNKEN